MAREPAELEVATGRTSAMPDEFSPEVTILDNEFVSVRRLGESGLIWVTRSSTPITALTQIDQTWGAVNRALLQVDRRAHVLLIDVRRAQGRNDDAFEQAVAKHRAATVQGFRRVGVLVQSRHGQLQVQRHVREDKLGEVRVFDNEALALEWLHDGAPPDRA